MDMGCMLGKCASIALISFLILLAGCMEKRVSHGFSIQSAVENAKDGATIEVPAGIYYESVVIDKSVKLIASGNASIVPEKEFAIKICADNVTVKGFNITFPSNDEQTFGIKIEGNNSTVEMNRISSCTYGIYVKWNCKGNRISRNLISGNRYGIYVISGSSRNEIFENNISWNVYGIRMKGKDSVIFRNVFYRNNFGILMCCGSGNNTVYMNNFIKNVIHAEDDRYTNKWSFNNTGNYWDNYNGTDADGDGRGDSPYPIPGRGGKKDEFPMMEPIEIDVKP
ncbi:MAG: right-handed parallel beta-helix repeat-containing protein [Thermoplasmata archaeon]|nr:right-handed parallel beta-helix repeat-containing protein [Thermoplasmata archaeon]